MSTFSPKRPDSRAKERYSPNGPNVTYTRRTSPSETHGTPAYGIQEIPVKKPLKTNFEKSKTDLNIKASKVRPSIDTSIRQRAESNRVNPIASNPIIPTGATKDTPTFRSSSDNPLSRRTAQRTSNGSANRVSSRHAARLKFEAVHSRSTTFDENKNAGLSEAFRDVKETKNREKTILRDNPHGATQGIIYHARPKGLSLPGLGFGSSSCQS